MSMAGRWMCRGGVEPVRVVHGDGQVLSLLPPVKVADILIRHPHHYICHMSPELPSNKSPMLSLDYDLEPGYLYFLLPLPRLFPTSSAGPPSCCCRVSKHDTSLGEGHTTHSRDSNGGTPQRLGFSPLRLKAVQHMMDRMGSPIRMARKKVSPELSRSPVSFGSNKLESTSPLLSPTYGSSKHSKRPGGIGAFSRTCSRFSKSSPSRSRDNNNATNVQGGLNGGMRDCGRSFMEDFFCSKWKPGLGCISETDTVVTAGEELRLCLDRRILTFDAKVPRSNSSPVRLADVCRIPARERLSKPPKDNGYYSDEPMRHMSLGNYVFV